MKIIFYTPLTFEIGDPRDSDSPAISTVAQNLYARGLAPSSSEMTFKL